MLENGIDEIVDIDNLVETPIANKRRFPVEMVGIAGGSFKKHQMMLGLYEMEDNSMFKRELELYRDEIMPLKAIPSPFDDCVDAFAAAYLGKMGRI